MSNERLKSVKSAERPTEFLNWNPSGSNVRRPSQTYIDNGIIGGKSYPAQYHSWFFWLIDKWLKFFDYKISKLDEGLGNVDYSGKVDKTTKVLAGTDLSGGGDLSKNVTLNVESDVNHTGNKIAKRDSQGNLKAKAIYLDGIKVRVVKV